MMKHVKISDVNSINKIKNREVEGVDGMIVGVSDISLYSSNRNTQKNSLSPKAKGKKVFTQPRNTMKEVLSY